MRCTSCGHEFPGQFGQACPACGNVVQNPFEPDAPRAGPTPWQAPSFNEPAPAGPELEAAGEGLPWEIAQSPGTLFQTMRLVLIESADAFAHGGLVKSIGPAFIFAMILGVIGGVLGMVTQTLLTESLVVDFLPEQYQSSFGDAFGVTLSSLVTIPIAVAIFLFVFAGIHHVALMMMGAANGGFESTFRVAAFASGATALFSLVPGVGDLVKLAWGIVIMTGGFRVLHDTTTGKALAAALFPILLCCFCAGTVGIFAAGVAGTAFGG